MQLDHIETFLDIMESRNFNRTADRLGVTQSTVSTRIRNLEQAIGSELFLRGRAGAEPTAAGRRFEAYAPAMTFGHSTGSRAPCASLRRSG
ncbi:MAG: LysR family transcriptional regulator [Mesorhizobium sp.]|nr:MAG: LysR family transcriptional regulator [Mesorhizobium sp.]